MEGQLVLLARIRDSSAVEHWVLFDVRNWLQILIMVNTRCESKLLSDKPRAV